MKRSWMDELELIREQNNGILHAAKVVEYARNENTALHSRFEWDDTEAAHQYRLEQARRLIRVNVYQSPANENKKVRALVSLTTDRLKPMGGYRALQDVLNDPELYQQLLEDAKADMGRFRQKYYALKELEGVITEIDKVIKKKGEKEVSAYVTT